ncbi:MAG: FAD/NAD(P)-binding protein [Pyrinomonadaceae bacterium]
MTGVDVILSLYHRKHEGKIFAFSTRGLLPAVYKLGCAYPPFYDELKSERRITNLLKIVRRDIEIAEAEGGNRRGVIDSLRPHTQEIWRNLPEPGKRYFMQHLSHYWNAARHRMPPECAKILDELQAKSQLKILKGRLKNIETSGEKFDVLYSSKTGEKHLAVRAIFNCIGSESDFNQVDSTLVKILIEKGLIKPDSLRMGIDATPNGKIIDAAGKIFDAILTLGTSLKGVLWETTAMPEIRAQAKNLALRILEE